LGHNLFRIALTLRVLHVWRQDLVDAGLTTVQVRKFNKAITNIKEDVGPNAAGAFPAPVTRFLLRVRRPLSFT
jgi:hypothetical protein